MTEILKCDLCGASAGNDPYHATIDENSHVHICNDCFNPEHHDLGVLWRKRERMLAKLKATESRLHEVSVFCATIEQQRDELLKQRDELLEALKGMVALYDTDEGCRSLPEYQAARDAICREIFRAAAETAKAGGES